MSPFWILWELRITAVVVTTEAIRRAKLQSNRHQRNKPTPSFSQARWPSLANVRQQNTIKVFLMLSVWEMTVAYVDSLHVRQKKKSLPKDIGLCVELWTYGPSGPSSNDNYLGHFKKLWLLTYLLTYLLTRSVAQEFIIILGVFESKFTSDFSNRMNSSNKST